MSVLSVPIKNDIVTQKDIFRFSATLFAETSNEYSTLESQLQMIKCVYTKNNNEPMTTEEIVVQLLDIFKYHVSEDEIINAIKKHKKTFQSVIVDETENFCLLPTVYEETVEHQKNNIDSYIEKFIQANEVTEHETCTDAIHKYLYELTTTNINTYRLLLCGKSGTEFSDNELSVNVSYLNEKEQQYVHDFVAWDDGDKNIALTNIVFTCLEYCLLVNGDKPNKLLSSNIRKREIYIDTNIIFRALGINGPVRKQTVTAFLNKCKQANLKLIISHNTRKEFFDTVDRYIDQILLFPRGNIYSGAYEQISDYTMFSFYEEWRQSHASLTLIYFKIYIKSLYEKMIKEYRMLDDEKIPKALYDSEQFKDTRNAYSSSIKKVKDDLGDRAFADDDRYSRKDSHDATVVHYVEVRREESEDTDLFFVSSDKILRFWDMSRTEKEYPVVIYPSQLFLVLIKTCGRSENDFESFVSFINIKSAHQRISAEKANAIISGISSITEDISSQQILVSAICDGEYQNIIKDCNDNDELYQAVQSISKNYLEEELKKKADIISSLQKGSEDKQETIVELRKITDERDETIVSLESSIGNKDKLIQTKGQKIKKQQKTIKNQKKRVLSFAEKKIMPKFIFCNYVVPVSLVLLSTLVLLFLLLQFFLRDKSWNFAILFFDWIKSTWFGEKVGDFVYSIDALFVGIMWWLLNKYMKNPFDKKKTSAEKTKMIQAYIEKNHLL